MNQSAYNFERCKLCGKLTAIPSYRLKESWIYLCSSCDFHFLSILDDKEVENKLDGKARNYIGSRLNESQHLHQERISLVNKYIDLNSIEALDIGAGLGQFQLLISEAGGKCLGIEPSSLRRQYAAEKFGVKLAEELVDHPCWQEKLSQHFDLITFWDVIEHVNFPRETLESAVRLLKPGGLFCLETPSRDVLSYRLSLKAYHFSRGKLSLFLPNFYSTARYGHKQIFTRQQLTNLLNSAGLEIIEWRHSYVKRLSPGNKMIVVARKR
jgi:2-polyprenyl-6-hydroxyphenyl methylase/3-demethylubiquinone-9 3-methyltransferase